MSNDIMIVDNFEMMNNDVPDFGDYESDLNTSLAGFAARNKISLKGQLFTLMRADGAPVPLPGDGDTLRVVIIQANPNNSKSYFGRDYDQDAEDTAPLCSSINGKTADTHIDATKALAMGSTLHCGTCPHNIKGSGKLGRGKACADRKHIVVLPLDDITTPYSVNLSVTGKISLQNHVSALQQIASTKGMKQLPLEFVVSEMYFLKRDPKTSEVYPQPRLFFRPVGFVTKEKVEEIKLLRNTEEVLRLAYLLEDTQAAPAQLTSAPAPAFNAPGPYTSQAPAPAPAPAQTPELTAAEKARAKILASQQKNSGFAV